VTERRYACGMVLLPRDFFFAFLEALFSFRFFLACFLSL